MKTIVFVFLAAGSWWSPIRLAAQDSLAIKTHACFRGRPLPRCSSFWTTEFGIAPRLTPAASVSGPLYTWELGGMRNLDTRNALGAAVFVEAADEGGAWGIRPRYRRWFNPTTALDLAPGLIIRSGGLPGFSGQVALNFSDYFALTSTVRITRRRDYLPANYGPSSFPFTLTPTTTTRADWFAGARLGGLPGTVVGLAVPTVVFFALLLVCGTGACSD